MIVPVSCWVWALNALQNSMMLTPCWPSAGPTGGGGVACPPGGWGLVLGRALFALRAFRLVELLDHLEAELHRNLALEDRDEHLQLLLIGVDVDDLPVEVREVARRDLDRFAELELDLRARPLAGAVSGVEDAVDLALRERQRLVPGADEARHARRVLHDRPRLVGHVHVHEHIAGEHPLLGLHLLAVLRLDHLLRRHDDAAEARLLVHRKDAVLEVLLHLVLVARVGVDDVPAEHRVPRRMTPSTRFRSPRSSSQRYAPVIAQAMITTIVPVVTWARPGHSTLRSSAADSRMKRPRGAGPRRPVCCCCG